MTVEQLAVADQALIRRCLAFLIEARPLEGEFETRLGVTPGEVAALLMRWPDVDDTADDGPACVAISNALNEVAHGLALTPADWHQLGTTQADVHRVLARWATLRSWHSTGRADAPAS